MFNSDKPILKMDDDKFERSSFARDLGKALLSFVDEDGICIGLLGEWGSGKTSLINMTLESIDKELQDNDDKPIVLRFQPWYFKDGDQLISQFFLQLASLFNSSKNEDLNAIGKLIENYGGVIEITKWIPNIGPMVATLGKWGLKGLAEQLKQSDLSEKSIYEQKKIIDKELSKLNQKIIVVIDDIDRLTNEQIRSVFQLVKSVCDFPNTIYLLSFDRNVVVKALQEIQEGDGEAYLEKVIQVPITIPPISQTKIEELLFERLNKLLEKYPNIHFEQDTWQWVYSLCIKKIIRTQRSANRLLNLLDIKMAAISDEVDFTDMVLITALETEEPEVFNWIKNNKTLFTGQLSAQSLFHHKDTAKRKEEFISEIEQLRNSSKNKNVLSTDSLVDTLERTFPPLSYSLNRVRGLDSSEALIGNRISHPNKFDRYFRLTLDAVAISKNEVSYLINEADKDSLIERMIELDNRNMLQDLLDEIEAYKKQMKTKRPEIIAEALIDSAHSFKSKGNRLSFSVKHNAQHLAYDLLSELDDDTNNIFIKKVISNMNANNADTISYLLNNIELAHGRLAAKDNPSQYDYLAKLVSESELDIIETSFVERAWNLVDIINLLDLPNDHLFLYLLRAFDSERTDVYLKKLLEEDINILKYLNTKVQRFTSSLYPHERYAMDNSYSEYVDDNSIDHAIAAVFNGDVLLGDNVDCLRSIAVYKLSKELESERLEKGITDEMIYSWLSNRIGTENQTIIEDTKEDRNREAT